MGSGVAGHHCSLFKIVMKKPWPCRGPAREGGRDRFSSSRWARPVLVPSPIMALHNRRGRFQKIKAFLDDGAAFAWRFFQARSIKHLHSAPVIADETGVLHRLHCKRHGFPVSPQDVRQKFMRIGKRLFPRLRVKSPVDPRRYRANSGNSLSRSKARLL